MEWELAHTLQAGYMKGGEKAEVVVLDVTSKLGSASEYYNYAHLLDSIFIVVIIQQVFLIFLWRLTELK